MSKLTHQMDTCVMGMPVTVDIYTTNQLPDKGGEFQPPEQGGPVVCYVKIFGQAIDADAIREAAQREVDEQEFGRVADRMGKRIDAVYDIMREVRDNGINEQEGVL